MQIGLITKCSYYYTININEITMTCNHDGLWEVIGGVQNLTCVDDRGNETLIEETGIMHCKNISIPDCVDRTVYCTQPDR